MKKILQDACLTLLDDIKRITAPVEEVHEFIVARMKAVGLLTLAANRLTAAFAELNSQLLDDSVDEVVFSKNRNAAYFEYDKYSALYQSECNAAHKLLRGLSENKFDIEHLVANINIMKTQVATGASDSSQFPALIKSEIEKVKHLVDEKVKSVALGLNAKERDLVVSAFDAILLAFALNCDVIRFHANLLIEEKVSDKDLARGVDDMLDAFEEICPYGAPSETIDADVAKQLIDNLVSNHVKKGKKDKKDGALVESKDLLALTPSTYIPHSFSEFNINFIESVLTGKVKKSKVVVPCSKFYHAGSKDSKKSEHKKTAKFAA